MIILGEKISRKIDAAFRVDDNQNLISRPNEEENMNCFKLKLWMFVIEPKFRGLEDNKLQELPKGMFENLISLKKL